MSKLTLFVLACLAVSAFAPASDGHSTPKPDLSTPNGTVDALYEVISGPAGEDRDPDAMRNLFHESAKMVSVGGAQDGKVRYNVITVEQYIERGFPSLKASGFFEQEVKNVTEIYGNVAHVFTTYESRRKKDDEKPFMRGINSVQLMNDGERWWIMSIVWQNEVPGITIPEKYLPGG